MCGVCVTAQRIFNYDGKEGLPSRAGCTAETPLFAGLSRSAATWASRSSFRVGGTSADRLASAKFLNCKTHFPRFDHIAGGGRKRLMKGSL